VTEFEIAFKFEGGLADQHALDGSDGVAFHEYARQFLALHAHFFVQGQVPKGGAINHTKTYRVLERATREGSIDLVYWVQLFAAGAVSAVGYNVGNLLYDMYLKECLLDLLTPAKAPPFHLRREPVFENTNGNREPIVDLDLESEQRWRDLRQRSRTSAIGWMKPIGRSAETVTVSPGNQRPIKFDISHLRYLREQEITQAVKSIRQVGYPMFLAARGAA
jgi:hypothetical protein